MADESTLALNLRTIDRRGWLHISWHAVAARVCLGPYPERGEASEAFPIAKLANTKYAVDIHLAQAALQPAACM